MLSEPSCFKRKCKYFLGVKNDGDESTERVYCIAFPNKIPDAISYGKNKHNEPYPGDHGILYEKVK